MSFQSCICVLQPFKVSLIFLSLIVVWVIRFMHGATALCCWVYVNSAYDNVFSFPAQKVTFKHVFLSKLVKFIGVKNVQKAISQHGKRGPNRNL